MRTIETLQNEVTIFLRDRPLNGRWPQSIRDHFFGLLSEQSISLAKLSREVGLDSRVAYGWRKPKRYSVRKARKVPKSVQVFAVKPCPGEELFHFHLKWKRLKIEVN